MDRGSKASARPCRTIPLHALGRRLYSVPDWSKPHQPPTGLPSWTSMVMACYVYYKVLTSGPLFLGPRLRASSPRVHGARPRVVPSSHHPGGCDARLPSPSDPCAQRGKTPLPVRHLPRQAPPRPDSWPVLPWQQTIPLMRFGACFIYVYLPVDYDAYAHAWWRFVIIDIPQPRPLDWLGPPPVGWRPRPSVPLAIEKGAGGVCPPRVSRHTPSLKA